MQSDYLLDYSFLKPDTSSSSYAFILLNRPIDVKYFTDLWIRASFRVLVDGASNLLLKQKSHTDANANTIDSNSIEYDYLYPPEYPPDVIIGDLDSILPDTRAHFESIGVKVIYVDNQDTTDIQKALDLLVEYKDDLRPLQHPISLQRDHSHQRAYGDVDSLDTNTSQDALDMAHDIYPSNKQHIDLPPLVVNLCLCFGAFGGRFDQSISNIVALHSHYLSLPRIVLFGDDNLIEIIHGVKCIDMRHIHPTAYCGLIPFCGRTHTMTYGLKWDIGDRQTIRDLTLSIFRSMITSHSHAITSLSSSPSPSSSPSSFSLPSPESPDKPHGRQLHLDIDYGTHGQLMHFQGMVSTSNQAEPIDISTEYPTLFQELLHDDKSCQSSSPLSLSPHQQNLVESFISQLRTGKWVILATDEPFVWTVDISRYFNNTH